MLDKNKNNSYNKVNITQLTFLEIYNGQIGTSGQT